MLKINDIFVDTCVASRLSNPLDPKLKTFLTWLTKSGAPVITNKIVGEYQMSLDPSNSNFFTVIDICTREGRVVKISNEQLKLFKFTKTQERKLNSNSKDWPHIKAVLISPRKIAISFDKNFVCDLNEFPGHTATAGSDPGKLKYK
jgi:hypothetical protein